MKRLNGKIVVVTDSNSGIGFATAVAFVNEGATVYITGRRKDALEAAATKIGQGCIPVQVDVTRQEDIRKLLRTDSIRPQSSGHHVCERGNRRTRRLRTDRRSAVRYGVELQFFVNHIA